MLAIERRNRVLEILQEQGQVTVSELSRLFEVSEETVRRDLDKLAQEGLCVKSYGGAIPAENSRVDMPYHIRNKRNVSAKETIAKLICEIIRDGDHLILDASSTAVWIARALRSKKNLTVITNSLEILMERADAEDRTMISSGGVLKEGYLALVGSKAEEALSAYNVEWAIMSCKGLDRERGATDGNEQFAQTKGAIMKAGGKKMLAVDHSKFDGVAFSKFADVSDYDLIVTDVKPDQRWIDFFVEQQVTCIYPGGKT